MFGKSRTLALAVATAGLIGMSATMASAATGPGSGDFGGLVNLSHNQVPFQICNDNVPINVIGGQVPIDALAAAIGLANPGSTVAESNTSCHQGASEADNNAREEPCRDCFREIGTFGNEGPTTIIEQDGQRGGDFGGLVNVSGNEIPVQVCNVTVPGNGIGVQVPLDHIAGGLGILSPGNTRAAQDSSCHSNVSQENANG